MNKPNMLHIVLMAMCRNLLLFVAVFINSTMFSIGAIIGYIIMENLINKAYFDSGVQSVTKVETNENN